MGELPGPLRTKRVPWYFKNLVDVSFVRQIAFEAVRGYSYKGDIALDEIKLAPGGCDTPATAAPSSTMQTVLPTTTSKPPVRSEGKSKLNFKILHLYLRQTKQVKYMYVTYVLDINILLCYTI